MHRHGNPRTATSRTKPKIHVAGHDADAVRRVAQGHAPAQAAAGDAQRAAAPSCATDPSRQAQARRAARRRGVTPPARYGASPLSSCVARPPRPPSTFGYAPRGRAITLRNIGGALSPKSRHCNHSIAVSRAESAAQHTQRYNREGGWWRRARKRAPRVRTSTRAGQCYPAAQSRSLQSGQVSVLTRVN